MVLTGNSLYSAVESFRELKSPGYPKYNSCGTISLKNVLFWLDGSWVWSSGADMDATAPVEAELKLVREEDQYHQEQIERMMGIPGISLK